MPFTAPTFKEGINKILLLALILFIATPATASGFNDSKQVFLNGFANPACGANPQVKTLAQGYLSNTIPENSMPSLEQVERQNSQNAEARWKSTSVYKYDQRASSFLRASDYYKAQIALYSTLQPKIQQLNAVAWCDCMARLTVQYIPEDLFPGEVGASPYKEDAQERLHRQQAELDRLEHLAILKSTIDETCLAQN